MRDSNTNTFKYKCIEIHIHWKVFQILFQILLIFRMYYCVGKRKATHTLSLVSLFLYFTVWQDYENNLLLPVPERKTPDRIPVFSQSPTQGHTVASHAMTVGMLWVWAHSHHHVVSFCEILWCICACICVCITAYVYVTVYRCVCMWVWCMYICTCADDSSYGQHWHREQNTQHKPYGRRLTSDVLTVPVFLQLYLVSQSHPTLRELFKRDVAVFVGPQLLHDLLNRVIHVQLTTHVLQVLTETDHTCIPGPHWNRPYVYSRSSLKQTIRVFQVLTETDHMCIPGPHWNRPYMYSRSSLKQTIRVF